MQGAKEEVSLVIVRADVLQHQEEEVSQGKRLHHVTPRNDVKVRGWYDLAHELDGGVDRDEQTYAKDLELLVWFREMRRMTKHQYEDGNDRERGSASCNDRPKLVKCEVASNGVRGCWENLLLVMEVLEASPAPFFE